MNLLSRLFKEEEGQAMTEYALIIGLVLLVVVVALSGVGAKIQEVFQDLIASFGEAPEGGN